LLLGSQEITRSLKMLAHKYLNLVSGIIRRNVHRLLSAPKAWKKGSLLRKKVHFGTENPVEPFLADGPQVGQERGAPARVSQFGGPKLALSLACVFIGVQSLLTRKV
jgi:hypothetical protein